MIPVSCPREQEVLSAILAGRWPGECDGELTAHAAHCGICGDVATVASVLRDDCHAAGLDIRVPAAGQVWWRAAVRARLDAAQAAARPITWIHGVTGASAAGLTATAVGAAWPWIRQGVDWASLRMSALEQDTAALAALAGDSVLRGLPFAIAIGACLVLAPIALYFALADD